jgi:hypothetical protein
MSFDSHSSTLRRIAALYAEQRALYDASWQRSDKQQRLCWIRLELEAAWQQRRLEKMREQLLRQSELHCCDCGERLTSANVIWGSRRPLRCCAACRRQRISVGRQDQLARDRAFVAQIVSRS